MAVRRDQEPVTIERIERALVVMAYIVTKYGDEYAPLFEAFERDLEEAKARKDTRSRANRLLESYTIEGGVRAIR